MGLKFSTRYPPVRLFIVFLLGLATYLFISINKDFSETNQQILSYELKKLNQMFSHMQMCPVNGDEYKIKLTNLSVTQSREDTKLGISGYTLDMSDFTTEFSPEDNYCVPKIFHFVWVGGSLLLPEYRYHIHTCIQQNPEYEVNLWTDTIDDELRQNLTGVRIRNITEEVEYFMVRDIFYNETNVGAMSDVLRYEIVYREGGTYMDTDAMCLKPYENLLTHSSVAHSYVRLCNLGNNFFAFPKGSNFLLFVLQSLHENKKNWDMEVQFRTGPAFLLACFLKYNDSSIQMIPQEHVVGPKDKNLIAYSHHSMDCTWCPHKKKKKTNKKSKNKGLSPKGKA